MRGLWVGIGLAGVLAGQHVHAEAEITVQDTSRIKAALSALKCKVNDHDIKRLNDGYVITDAFCADGQYSIRLNAEFQVVDKRAE